MHEIVWLDVANYFTVTREKFIYISAKHNSQELLKCLQKLTNNNLFFRKKVEVKPEKLLMYFGKLVAAVFGDEFLTQLNTPAPIPIQEANTDEATSTRSGSTYTAAAVAVAKQAGRPTLDFKKLGDPSNLPKKLLGEHAGVEGLCQLVL